MGTGATGRARRYRHSGIGASFSLERNSRRSKPAVSSATHLSGKRIGEELDNTRKITDQVRLPLLSAFLWRQAVRIPAK